MTGLQMVCNKCMKNAIMDRPGFRDCYVQTFGWCRECGPLIFVGGLGMDLMTDANIEIFNQNMRNHREKELV